MHFGSSEFQTWTCSSGHELLKVGLALCFDYTGCVHVARLQLAFAYLSPPCLLAPAAIVSVCVYVFGPKHCLARCVGVCNGMPECASSRLLLCSLVTHRSELSGEPAIAI